MFLSFRVNENIYKGIFCKLIIVILFFFPKKKKERNSHKKNPHSLLSETATTVLKKIIRLDTKNEIFKITMTDNFNNNQETNIINIFNIILHTPCDRK